MCAHFATGEAADLPFAAIRRNTFRIDEEFARATPRFYCEILLAALLIMCNAAENFWPQTRKSCGRSKINAVKSKFSVALCAERQKDSLPGSSRRSNRPPQLERALCLLL
jgi:hypothetical protein